MVGLGNCDDTTDLNKPISTATQTALDLKAPLASPSFTGNVTSVQDIMVNGIIVGKGGASYLAGSRNTCFGNGTLTNYINTTIPVCCAIGDAVLTNCTSGVSNTAVSNYGALYTNITGSSNTAVGNRVLEQSLSSFDTGLGDSAGWNLTTGDKLTSCGYYSGYNITTGTLNCAFGSNAYATTNYSNSSALVVILL